MDTTIWITQAEAAKILQLTRGRVSQLAGSGQLRTQKLFGKLLVDRASVENFQRRPVGRPKK